MILCVIFSRSFLWNTTQKILIKFFVLLDIFSIRFSPYSAIDPSKIVEVVVNLFMKLQTSTVTKLVNLGIKLELIEFQIRSLCQFNSIFSEKSYIKNIFLMLWRVDRTVLPDSLEITILGTRSIQKSRWNSPPLT